MNSLISLSLEAERCLQNTLIKASDILEEIEKTGKYTPPKIFFNFRGFIMFEIREKPFSLLNYKGWEYVSLFQLYFDYYSPIYFRHPYFSQFRVYHEPNRHRHFGFVNFNLQELSIQVVKKNQKIVVFHNDFANEEFEVSDWENYYQYYGTSWKQYDLDQYDFQK